MENVCEIHSYHRPRHLLTESHHVLPRAWQAVWQPMREERNVWYPKTIELCPTGHGGVHHILVEIMREYEAQPKHAIEEVRLQVAEAAVRARYRQHKEFPIACLAPRLWKSKGGLLDTLINRRQYGWGLSHRQFVDR